MSELVRVGRTHPSLRKTKVLAQCIYLDLKGGRFRFLDDVGAILLHHGNKGIMFSFNINAARAYAFEDNEEDSYYPRWSKSAGWRFSSNGLKDFFVRVFALDESKRYHSFIVNETRDHNNGMYELIYVDK